MIVSFYSATEGDVWKGKLNSVPHIGESIIVNNKTSYGRYKVMSVEWRVDEKSVSIKLSHNEVSHD